MKELTLEATVENIEPMSAFVNACLESLGCPAKVQMQLNIAMDEILSNIAHYAYHPNTGPVTVRVEQIQVPLAMVLTFADRGVPFDPLKSMDPDISLSSEDRQLGGLGIYIVKKSMDEVSYTYKDCQNILRIRKNI